MRVVCTDVDSVSPILALSTNAQANFYYPDGSYCRGNNPFKLFILDESEPKLRPWNTDEVPVGALIRGKTWEKKKGVCTVLLSNGVLGVSFLYSGVPISMTRESLAEQTEHSTDGGKTWKPCGIVE